MNRLRRIIQVMIGALALALLVAAVPAAQPAAAAPNSDLLYFFEGRVRKGPSKGTLLAGPLRLTPGEAGSVAGTLTLEDGTAVPVSGRLASGNLNVTFDLGNDVLIFGIGQADEDGVFKGPFIGPAAGDSGKWEASPLKQASFNFSGTVTRGPSTGTTLAGVIDLTIDIDDEFTGTFTSNGTAIPVEGELSNEGKKIEITFLVAEGVRIRGEGKATSEGGFAGPFRGPQSGDQGDWVATPAE
jgi:hypothetical protein